MAVMPVNRMLSIIIPAYNEASVITRTLNSILSDGSLSHTQIVVVCNACHDDTARVVERFTRENKAQLESKNSELLIVETEIASKTNAINLGQSHAIHSQRILLDADILVSGTDLLTLCNEMRQQGALIASPRLVFNYKNSGFWVRHYYRVASISTYNRFLRISNVIALSEQATKRLGTLPQIIADDDYIRRQFADTEKVVVDKCHFEFICPTDLASLLKALTRVRIGNIQLNSMQPGDVIAVKRLSV